MQRGECIVDLGNPVVALRGARRNALTFTSASTPTLSGKTVERWVDPLGLHFAKTLVVELALMIALFAGCRLVQPWD